jgi:hypothetical protein
MRSSGVEIASSMPKPLGGSSGASASGASGAGAFASSASNG